MTSESELQFWPTSQVSIYLLSVVGSLERTGVDHCWLFSVMLLVEQLYESLDESNEEMITCLGFCLLIKGSSERIVLHDEYFLYVID